MVMPNYTNPLNNLMGGHLLKWMDTVAAVCAGKHAESHVVTASVDNVSFKSSIPNGDVVTLKARVTRAFKTSLEVYVEVFAANMKGLENRRCNDAYFTMVAVDENTLKPHLVPPIIPLSAEEQDKYESALRRRQLRLIMAGRMKPEEATELKRIFV